MFAFKNPHLEGCSFTGNGTFVLKHFVIRLATRVKPALWDMSLKDSLAEINAPSRVIELYNYHNRIVSAIQFSLENDIDPLNK